MAFKSILGKTERVSIESTTSDFVSLASHQLRTPLSAIKWNTEILLSQRQGKLSAKQIQYLREIYRSNERAINLVNDLLDVSRIQEGKIHLDFRPARVEEIVEEVIEYFYGLIKASQVSINFEIVNGPLPKVETDREKVKRVIMNLLSNSIKYTPAEGKVKITVAKNRGHLKISVSDSGVGIPKADQKKIFKRFFRSTNVIKLAPDGTGLGLFIAKSLVEAMGGKIWFDSEQNKGTTFYFTLPFKL